MRSPVGDAICVVFVRVVNICDARDVVSQSQGEVKLELWRAIRDAGYRASNAEHVMRYRLLKTARCVVMYTASFGHRD